GSCRHEPDPACYCRPTEDGKRCNEAHCENSEQRCQPRCINVDPPTGEWTIRRCDCVSPALCHAVPPQPGALMPSCEGACPPGMTCERREIPQADGTITICCNCIPEQPEECRPNAEKTGC